MPLRKVAVGSALAAAVLIAALPADAGGNGHVVVTAAKHKSGPYKGGVVGAGLPSGENKAFFVKVKNKTSNAPVAVEMSQDAADIGGYSQKYFRGKSNVTNDVLDNGLEFNVRKGNVKRFRIKIKRAGGATLASYCSFTRFQELSPGSDTAFALLSLNGDPCDG